VVVRKPALGILAALVGLALLAPAASAKERVLTLYSPKIQSLPYVHDTHHVTLRADGREAPAEPGYITGWKEMALVDSKDPKAKPLPMAKMMVHHFLYFAPGTDSPAPGSCWGSSGFIGGRGEEHPLGHMATPLPASTRARYGIVNRNADGTAPDWRLTAMVMNHFKRPKGFYVRTRVHYTTEPRKPILPIVLGDCSHLRNGMSYDVPGGGRKGSNFVSSSDWVVPEGLNGRILLGASHHHGGAKYQTLQNRTCQRRIFKAPAYHGMPDHVYNTIRPILHEPGPIGNGTFATRQGVPITEGEVLRRVAVHDNHNLHVASMGFWVLYVAPDDSVKRCGKMPTDMVDINRPRRFDRTPNHDLKVPQLAKPAASSGVFSGAPLEIGDDFFQPGTITAKVGETVTWRFGGTRPHSVTVANGPRGFSSVYWGQTRGTYSVTPTVKGTYRLVCLVHPTSMAQTLKVR
jgi:plastocyanin